MKDITNKQADEWNYNMAEAPLDTAIELLSSDNCLLLPQRKYVGTISDNGRYRVRGECIEGDPDYFYRSAIIAWKPISNRRMSRFKEGIWTQKNSQNF